MKGIVWLAAALVAGCAIKGSPTAEVYLDDRGHLRYVPAEHVNAFSPSSALHRQHR
ncbi:MAG: hypothetical protein ACREXR_20155 [Gammaproteobacteria bacterium]